MENRKNLISEEDFSMHIIDEDVFSTASGGDGIEPQNIGSVTVSIWSVTSTTNCSNATNTYTELSCC